MSLKEELKEDNCNKTDFTLIPNDYQPSGYINWSTLSSSLSGGNMQFGYRGREVIFYGLGDRPRESPAKKPKSMHY